MTQSATVVALLASLAVVLVAGLRSSRAGRAVDTSSLRRTAQRRGGER